MSQRYTVEQLAKMPPAQALDALLTQPADEQKQLMLAMDHQTFCAIQAESLVRNLNAKTARLGPQYGDDPEDPANEPR